MGTFDFLSGMSGPNANAQASIPMQQYQQFQPQTDYSQVLGGGQAQSPATQGLDFSKIGQWALQQGQYQGQQAQQGQGIGQMGPTQPTQHTMPTQSPLQAHARAVQLGQVAQGQSGYIGGNTKLGLLGSIR